MEKIIEILYNLFQEIGVTHNSFYEASIILMTKP